MSEDMKSVTTERVEKYLDITKRARAKATSLCEEGSVDAQKLAVMMRMADDYASDAAHFLSIGDHVRAFGAINYAHAWIDAGVKIGFLDGHGDDVLFTLP
jgi:hypothetical protein